MNDRAIVATIDDRIGLLLATEIDGFIDGDGFVVQAVEDVDGVSVGSMEDAISDVLVWVVA